MHAPIGLTGCISIAISVLKIVTHLTRRLPMKTYEVYKGGAPDGGVRMSRVDFEKHKCCM